MCKYLLGRKIGRKPVKETLIESMKLHIPDETDIDLRYFATVEFPKFYGIAEI